MLRRAEAMRTSKRMIHHYAGSKQGLSIRRLMTENIRRGEFLAQSEVIALPHQPTASVSAHRARVAATDVGFPE